MEKTPITVAFGDGIGPEIMQVALDILKEAGAQLEIETIEIGEKLYLRGITSGIDDKSWASLVRTKVFLKAPITTPQGGGYKSLNVTARKTLGLYANIRPCVSYHPFVETTHPKMDIVIVRENEEDTYAGIEHRQTDEVYQCLKIISRPGSERVIRCAFEYARNHGRKKVTCFVKDNIMKMTDGIFHKVFDEIRGEYPAIEADHWIVDIGAAKLAATPERFDVVVMPNLYGDILSDVMAQIAGSVGLAGSANIGDRCAMFEAIHGSAPRRAGQGIVNPSGILLAAVMMLVHIGQREVAERVHNAWLKTLEDGYHTYDIHGLGTKERVKTIEFANEVIKRLGKTPEKLKAVSYAGNGRRSFTPPAIRPVPRPRRELVGVDVFIYEPKKSATELGRAVESIRTGKLKFVMVSNRGVKVYPHGMPETFLSDHWQCRYESEGEGARITHEEILDLLAKMKDHGLDFIKTENLYRFDGVEGYSKAQGQ